MKREKITAILLALVTLGSAVVGCSSTPKETSRRTDREETSDTDDTQRPSETFHETQSTIRESWVSGKSDNTEYDPAIDLSSASPENRYHIGDHQILARIEDISTESHEYDGQIPEDFDNRYSDIPMMVELAHEYAESGNFYDFYESAIYHEYAGDWMSLEGNEYAFIHGFRVEVTDSKFTEERYYVTLMPEELLTIYLSQWGEEMTPTEYGYSISLPGFTNENPEEGFVFCYDYYTDSQLLVYHYGTNCEG